MKTKIKWTEQAVSNLESLIKDIVAKLIISAKKERKNFRRYALEKLAR